MRREYLSYPKINICFKIVGLKENGYCDILSRYFLVDNGVCDTLYFSDCDVFDIKGDFDCTLKSNTIFKAKEILKSAIPAHKKEELEHFCIEVQKNIPMCAGLGGGSSNAGVYLLAMNDMLDLGLSKNDLLSLSKYIGADVSFFVSGNKSANVYGVGEQIVEFMDCEIDFEIFTPPILCKTKEVYDEFKRCGVFSNISFNTILESNSREILHSYNFLELNDLYIPALRLYPELKDYSKSGYYFSGSGSSFFRIKS